MCHYSTCIYAWTVSELDLLRLYQSWTGKVDYKLYFLFFIQVCSPYSLGLKVPAHLYTCCPVKPNQWCHVDILWFTWSGMNCAPKYWSIQSWGSLPPFTCAIRVDWINKYWHCQLNCIRLPTTFDDLEVFLTTSTSELCHLSTSLETGQLSLPFPRVFKYLLVISYLILVVFRGKCWGLGQWGWAMCGTWLFNQNLMLMPLFVRETLLSMIDKLVFPLWNLNICQLLCTGFLSGLIMMM